MQCALSDGIRMADGSRVCPVLREGRAGDTRTGPGAADRPPRAT